jgi:hypothetical protein
VSVAANWRKTSQHDRVWLTGVLSMCLGFVHAFEQEVERFKDYLALMGRAVNPHRQHKVMLRPAFLGLRQTHNVILPFVVIVHADGLIALSLGRKLENLDYIEQRNL